MKKFKSILALTASVLALSAFAAPVSAFATDTEITPNNIIGDDNPASLGVEAGTPETYTVTIPATAVDFGNAEDTKVRTVNVKNVFLGANRQLTVTVNTTQGDANNFKMANYTVSGATRTYNDNKISYNVSIGETAISPNATIVTVAQSNLGDAGTGSGLDTTLSFSLPENVTYPVAGTYADVMTFTIAVDDAS